MVIPTTTPAAPGARLKGAAAAVLLLFSCWSASALTLGRVQGTAWLGQPLDVRVTLQMDEPQGLDALCLAAEVFHGDAQQDPSRVRVALEPGSQPQAATVRVRSSVPVDEPVVTIQLKETCLSKTARRFVLLAEIPPEALTPGTAPEVISAPVPAAASGAVTDATRPAEAARPQSQDAGTVAAAAPRVRAASKLAVPRHASSAAPARKKAKEEAAPAVLAAADDPPKSKSRPKLKLTLADSLSDRVARLEATVVAQTPPPGPTAQEIQDAQRMLKLEQSLQSLVSLSARNERSMAELREQLRRAEEEKYQNPVVYGLAGLSLLALGGVAVLWRRQRQLQVAASAPGWWDQPGGEKRAPVVEAALPTAVVVGAGGAAVAAAAFAVHSLAATDATASSEAGDADPLPLVPAVEPQASAGGEVDLDDLLAPSAAGAAPVDEFTRPADVVDASELPPLDVDALPAHPEESFEPLAQHADGATASPEFPAAGEVSIDISHLSLSLDEPATEAAPESTSGPVSVSEQVAQTASLLDFDLELPGQTAAHAPAQAADEADKPDTGVQS